LRQVGHQPALTAASPLAAPAAFIKPRAFTSGSLISHRFFIFPKPFFMEGAPCSVERLQRIYRVQGRMRVWVGAGWHLQSFIDNPQARERGGVVK
jgi:hypothetical protein